jgi:uncharacterized membrane protein YgcG
MLERGEAIGLLVVLAVMLAATLYVGVRRSPSFAVVFAPVELVLAGWVAASARWDRPDGDGPRSGGTVRGPGGRDGGGGGVREPRRPRPGSGSGSATRHH